MCSHEESNLNYKIRNLASYPLNDESDVRPAGIEPTSSIPKIDVLSVELRAQNYLLIKLFYTIFKKIALV